MTTTPAPLARTVADPVRPVGRFEWRLLEVGALEGVSADLAGRRIVVLGGEDAAAGALVACLQNVGARAVAVPANVRLVPAGLIDQLGAIDIVIDLNVGTADIGDAADAWPRQLARTLQLLRACAADWTAETDCRRLGYVPVTRTGGQLGAGSAPVSHPMGGLWVGLAKGLPREIPNCNVRVVDLVDEPLDPAELAELVVAELYRWGLFEIAHRDGRRYTLQARRYPAGAPVRSFGPADTVVMSGGGRGIGFALALDFATRYGARVIVTGRAPLPDPQDPELTLDEAGFAAYRADGCARAPRTGNSSPCGPNWRVWPPQRVASEPADRAGRGRASRVSAMRRDRARRGGRPDRGRRSWPGRRRPQRRHRRASPARRQDRRGR